MRKRLRFHRRHYYDGTWYYVWRDAVQREYACEIDWFWGVRS